MAGDEGNEIGNIKKPVVMLQPLVRENVCLIAVFRAINWKLDVTDRGDNVVVKRVEPGTAL